MTMTIENSYHRFSNAYFQNTGKVYGYLLLSEGIKMYKIKSVLLDGKTGFNIIIVHFYIRRKLDIIQNDA